VASALPPQAKLFQAGLLGARSRHPEGLTKLLAQDFRVPVRIESNILQWLALGREDQSPLGYSRGRAERPAAPHRLGVSATSGTKVRDRQYKFRIGLGPLTLAQYQGFLPGGAEWLRLRDWVLQYTGLDLQWDVQLVLGRDHVPRARAGRHVRLGVSTWIGRPEPGRDRSDLRLRPGTSFLLRRVD
jgi:type VI secretion system protein ImpH